MAQSVRINSESAATLITTSKEKQSPLEASGASNAYKKFGGLVNTGNRGESYLQDGGGSEQSPVLQYSRVQSRF